MTPEKQKTLFRAFLLVALLSVGVVVAYFFVGVSQKHSGIEYGVTWSDTYAASLGVDPQAGLIATLDDLDVKRFRLPVYWNEVEPSVGEFTFYALEKNLEALAKRGAKAILVVGATEPRWPECWMPDWATNLAPAEREKAQMDYVRTVVEKFNHHPAVEAWQVENEPLLILFGECKNQRRAFLHEEIRLVNAMTDKPVLTTDSGELSTWTGFAGLTDKRGVSVYRVVLTSWFGIWRYPLPPFFYERKARLVEWLVGDVFVSEFQMEPWALQPLPTVPLDEQFKTFDSKQMRDNFDYATRIGLSPVYFWGAEWWYWMKEKKGHPEFWEEAKTFLRRY